MERLKQGRGFWVLLLAAVILPSTLLANKQLYQAPISADGQQKGVSIITLRPGIYEYAARTHALPNYAVQSVNLTNGTWSVPLCLNGGAAEDDCTYDASGNLDIEGPISGFVLVENGVSASAFNTALRNGLLNIQVKDGSGAVIGSGAYVRIF